MGAIIWTGFGAFGDLIEIDFLGHNGYQNIRIKKKLVLIEAITVKIVNILHFLLFPWKESVTILSSFKDMLQVHLRVNFCYHL